MRLYQRPRFHDLRYSLRLPADPGDKEPLKAPGERLADGDVIDRLGGEGSHESRQEVEGRYIAIHWRMGKPRRADTLRRGRVLAAVRELIWCCWKAPCAQLCSTLRR